MTMRILLLAALAVVPTLASAQSLEVFAMTGVVQLWDDEGNIGNGVPLGGGVGFRSPHGWGVEALAEAHKATRDFDSGVRFDSTVAAGRARIVKYLGAGATQPYVGGGLGVTRVKSARTEPFNGNVFRRTSTSGALSAFAGLRIAAGSALFVRPEFEFLKAGEHIRLGGIVAVGASW
jgi:opacity protein-like surface antigen